MASHFTCFEYQSLQAPSHEYDHCTKLLCSGHLYGQDSWDRKDEEVPVKDHPDDAGWDGQIVEIVSMP